MTGHPTNWLAASILEAANLVRRGQWQQGEAQLAQVLAAHPGEPDALQLLGLVRENQNRLTEAEALLRQSLAARPSQPHVQVHLGRVLAQAGRHQDAIDLLQAAAAAQPDLFDAFLVLAQVQLTMGDLAAAEENYRAALRLSPKSQVALLGLGILLNKTMRPAEAEACLQAAATDDARPPPWRARVASHLGQSLELQGKQEQALDAWRRALALDPTNAEAHRELNALLYRMGRTDEFLSSHDTAIRQLPLSRAAQRGTLLLQKAGFLMDAERFEEARDCFAQVAALAPGSAGPQNGLAAAHARLGQLDAAVAAYETSIRLQPDDPATGIHLASVLLQAGEPARALRFTSAAMPRLARDQAALAVHELALRANNDPRAEHLADYERHIQIFDLEPPPGFSSMADFNAALDAYLDTRHTDLREPVDQTLRHGTQTAPSLLRGENALLGALRQRIEEAVGVYIARMADDADHPLSGRRTAGFAFAGSWSSRLHDCGFHANHVHPEGWISSCYYVAVPDAAADLSAKQGWIKFGEPSFDTAMHDAIRRTVQPMPGRLVLFPSYMWHGTTVFRSAAARTTIAFDAVPT